MRRLWETQRALTRPHAHRALVEVQVVDVEGTELTHPEPAAVQQLQHGIVASSHRGRVLLGAGAGMIEERVSVLLDRLGDHVYGFDDETLETAVVRLLDRNSWTVATAESWTC